MVRRFVIAVLAGFLLVLWSLIANWADDMATIASLNVYRAATLTDLPESERRFIASETNRFLRDYRERRALARMGQQLDADLVAAQQSAIASTNSFYVLALVAAAAVAFASLGAGAVLHHATRHSSQEVWGRRLYMWSFWLVFPAAVANSAVYEVFARTRDDGPLLPVALTFLLTCTAFMWWFLQAQRLFSLLGHRWSSWVWPFLALLTVIGFLYQYYVLCDASRVRWGPLRRHATAVGPAV